MTQNKNIYTADKGNFIIRISDQFIMGELIDLGSSDSIENYEEQPYTEESYNEFYGISSEENSGDIPKEEKVLLLGKNSQENKNIFDNMKSVEEFVTELKSTLYNLRHQDNIERTNNIQQEP